MKQKTYLLLLINLLLLVILLSCAEDAIPSNEVYVGEILRYYEASCINSDTTYITATFLTEANFDTQNNPFGKRVVLEPPSNITFNGKLMQEQEELFGGTVYKISVDSKWPKKFEWVWMDNEGKKHVDSAAMNTIDLPGEWLLQDGIQYAVVWKGSPVREGEEITVSIENDDESWYESTRKAGARSVTIDGMIFGLDPFGYYNVKISRTLRIRNQDETLAGDTESGSYIKLIYMMSN